MKILYAVDYYYPFTPGGSEWSVYYLAKSLQERNVGIKIITPNYGDKPQDIVNGIKVTRFGNPIKSSNKRRVINPIWQNNPIFFLWSSFSIYKIIKKEK